MYKNDSLREQIAFEQRSLHREDATRDSEADIELWLEHPSTLTEVNSEFHIGLNGKERLKVVKRRGFEKTLIAEQKQVGCSEAPSNLRQKHESNVNAVCVSLE